MQYIVSVGRHRYGEMRENGEGGPPHPGVRMTHVVADYRQKFAEGIPIKEMGNLLFPLARLLSFLCIVTA